MGKFEGESVLVLVGNHDFSLGPNSKLWMQFYATADSGRVTELRTCEFESYDYGDRIHAFTGPKTAL